MSTTNIPAIIAYDNDDHDDNDTVDKPVEEETITLTQAKLNEMMANHKRSLQTELQQTKESLQETEARLSTLLESKELTESTTNELEATLENVRKQLETKEETAKKEQLKLQKEWQEKFENEQQRAEQAINQYHTLLKEQALMKAAGGDEYDSQQFLDIMLGKATLVEDQVMVDLPDFDVDGNPTTSQLTPVEAISRMKELPKKYGNLFRSNLKSGVGATNATGGVNSGNKPMNIEEMTHAQFKAQYEADPSALGL